MGQEPAHKEGSQCIGRLVRADELLGNQFGEIDYNFIETLIFFIFKLIVNDLLEQLVQC